MVKIFIKNYKKNWLKNTERLLTGEIFELLSVKGSNGM